MSRFAARIPYSRRGRLGRHQPRHPTELVAPDRKATFARALLWSSLTNTMQQDSLPRRLHGSRHGLVDVLPHGGRHARARGRCCMWSRLSSAPRRFSARRAGLPGCGSIDWDRRTPAGRSTSAVLPVERPADPTFGRLTSSCRPCAWRRRSFSRPSSSGALFRRSSRRAFFAVAARLIAGLAFLTVLAAFLATAFLAGAFRGVAALPRRPRTSPGRRPTHGRPVRFRAPRVRRRRRGRPGRPPRTSPIRRPVRRRGLPFRYRNRPA